MPKFENLKGVVDHLKENGLPSADEMRYQLFLDQEKVMAEGREKLAEYKELFTKFQEGTITDEEKPRMIQLSDELEELKKRVQ